MTGNKISMRRSPSILASIAIVLATLAPAVASADSFGAIAYSPATGATGWAHSFPNRSGAERMALGGCSKSARDCRVAIWFKNACGAVARGSDGWGSGWGNDRRRAELEAIGSCNQYTGGCRVIRWQCSGAR